ncbi:RHS repeat-associated core domain-containing protein [Candidatus Merdisoma sp. JLR.KK006]|uniref:RHS repeat-associated core domain-containing protein n=1 Tax=Candidatus Merdisoma sp. JLR.KK006 TaxID=3112626 RepID=UPI0033130964
MLLKNSGIISESPKIYFLNNDHGNYVFATFTGHIYDTILDIYFAEARFYDANNRTWLAMDPIKDGLNWYQYCYRNPTTYWDPLGLEGAVGTLSHRVWNIARSNFNKKLRRMHGSFELCSRLLGFK